MFYIKNYHQNKMIKIIKELINLQDKIIIVKDKLKQIKKRIIISQLVK